MEFGVLFTSHPNPPEEPYPFAKRVIPAFRPPARQVAAAE